MTLEEIIKGGEKEVFLPDTYETIKIKLPQNIREGSILKVKKKTGNKIREYHLKVRLLTPEGIKIDNSDLYIEKEIPVTTFFLGGEVEITTPEGKRIKAKVPAMIKPGAKLRLKGLGLPKTGVSRGDLFVVLQPSIPKRINPEQRELLEKLRALGL